MLNFLLICGLFILVIILFAQISSMKSRLRFMEYLLKKQQAATEILPEAMQTPEQPQPVMKEAPVATIVPIENKTPGLLNRLFQQVYTFFTGGNSFVRIGILVLFIGVAFLLKYAAQFGYFTVGMRLLAVAILAFILFAVGFLLKNKRFVYAMTLEGGALAILYLLCFTSFYRYQLLSATMAIVLLILITGFTLFCAIRNNVKTLAVLGIIGGFLAPIIINTSNPNPMFLFSYYLILNIGVFITAWFRQWRMLNILGFIFTFVITALWYWHSYAAQDFIIAETFLFIFFTFYLIVAVLTAWRQAPQNRGFIESSLVFALPAVVFALQANLLDYSSQGLAITAIGLGMLYAGLAFIIYYLAEVTLVVLAVAFGAISLVFFTAAVPLLLTGEWTSAIWTLEGAALIWVGIKQQRYLLRLMGVVIGMLANLYFFNFYYTIDIFQRSWFDNTVLNYYLLTITNLLSAYFLYKVLNFIKPWEKIIARMFFAIGVLWWLIAISNTALVYYPANYFDIGLLILLSIAALLGVFLAKISNCHWFKIISFSLLPFMMLLALDQYIFFNWSEAISWYWCVGFMAWYAILWIYRNEPISYLDFGHIGAYTLLSCLIAWYSHQWLLALGSYSFTWNWCIWAVIPAIFLLLLHVNLRFIKMIFNAFFEDYAIYLSCGFGAYLLGWTLLANLQLEGTANPWPYLLLLNPLDLSSIFVLIIVSLRCFQGKYALIKVSNISVTSLCYTIAIISFIWANAAILRFLHFSYAVTFSTEGFLVSQLTQVVLSIFWGLLALLTTVIGNQKHWRPVWFAGAVMIGITILKLFIVDLSNSGTLERIIAFISVGVILLLIGYFAPLPPKQILK